MRAERLLLEYDDERSGGFQPLAAKTIDGLETRIREAARYVPLERLALSPQCGFATSILGNALTADDEEEAKLRTIVATAERVWG